jgi:hypothetical protein
MPTGAHPKREHREFMAKTLEMSANHTPLPKQYKTNSRIEHPRFHASLTGLEKFSIRW